MSSLPHFGCLEYMGSSEKSPHRFSDDLLAQILHCQNLTTP
ncbi:hypothetical protein HMPREF9418_1421 [Neisseria macacae ATCC 33926]|uniref:Uncharacterized protein n=1 Tax=Neisseria macacae ATCC 33926 TaxID=997348 RepID=A0AA36UJA8_9NEIS|nr:hypothetical protein HMPREF9418_1421 [Neisseria macacae ATCC 33926]